MLAHHLRLAWRLLTRHPMQAAINLFGLTVGLAAALLILLFVRHELSYEQFLDTADRAYRLVLDARTAEVAPSTGAATPQALAPTLQTLDLPGVEAIVAIENWDHVLGRDGQNFYERFHLVGPAFFQVLPFAFLHGDPATALATPSSIVLSAETARKHFGTTDAVGRVMTVENRFDVTVTGVLAPARGPTQFYPDAVMRRDFDAGFQPSWDNWNGPTLVLLAPDADPAAVFPALDGALRPIVPESRRQTFDDYGLIGEALPDLHLRSGRWSGSSAPASETLVYGLALVAVLLLAMVAINYTNMAMAQATRRLREASLRRVLGAGRGRLIVQFLGESALLTGLALVLALALVELTVEPFADHLGLRTARGTILQADILFMGAALALAVGIVGGLWPALALSGGVPADALRPSGGTSGAKSGRLREVLVWTQVVAAVSLTICTAIAFTQTRFAAEADLGFEADRRLMLTGIARAVVRDRLPALKTALAAIPGVEAVSAAWVLPGQGSSQTRDVRLPGGDPSAPDIGLEQFNVDFGYPETMGIDLLAGRTFDPAFGADMVDRGSDGTPLRGANVLLSAGGVRELGLGMPQDALGRTFTMDGLELTVVGVVADVRMRNARAPVQPAYYIVDPEDFPLQSLVLRLSAGAPVASTLAAIETAWTRMVPAVPVSRRFVDEQLRALYLPEWRLIGVLAAFSALTVAISLLGLFALSAYEAERRTKEIGVRKVLGAGTATILGLLVWRFSRPVLLALPVAWGLSWVLLSRWLDGFTTRIALDPLTFALAGGVALAIAGITVAVHALKVAWRPPVLALRYE